MEGFYRWIQNIVYYLIFITMLTNLLPAGKYEKYLRLFSGCILIMLVLQPLTGSLRLEEQITSLFHSFSFENDIGELTQGMEEMEARRMETLVKQYEKTAADDIRRLAAMEGLEVREVSVEIAGDQSSPDFGKMKRVTVLLDNQDDAPVAAGDRPGAEKDRPRAAGDRPETGEERSEAKTVELVDPVNIRIELENGENQNGAAVAENGSNQGNGNENSPAGEDADSAKDRAASGGAPDSSQVSAGGSASSSEAAKLRRQISGCYQLEERYVEIRLENE